MPLQKQYLDIAFGISGIAQKADPKVIDLPQMARIENAICERPGALQLRPGYETPIATEDSPVAAAYRVGIREGRPVIFSRHRGKISEYRNDSERSYDASHWHTAETEQAARSSERVVYTYRDYRPAYVDSAIVGNYLCVVCNLYNVDDWDSYAIPERIVALIFDANTYAFVRSIIISNTAYMFLQAKAKIFSDGTLLHVIHSWNSSGARWLSRWRHNPATNLTYSSSGIVEIDDHNPWFDVCYYQGASYYWLIYFPAGTSNYPTVARVPISSGAIDTWAITANGLGGTRSYSATAININTAHTQLGVIYETLTGIYMSFLPVNVSSVTSSVTLGVIADYNPLKRAEIVFNNDTWYVLYEANSTTTYYDYIRAFGYISSILHDYTYQTAHLRHRALAYAEPAGSQYGLYVGLSDYDDLEGTHYTAIAIPDTNVPVGYVGASYMRIMPIAQYQTYIAVSEASYTDKGVDFLTHLNEIATDIYQWATTVMVSTNGYGTVGIAINELNFTSDKLLQSVDYNRQLLLASSMPRIWDGTKIGDLGLIPRPVISAEIVENLTGFHLEPGTYQYSAIFEYRDVFGNLYRSRPAIPISVTIGSETNPSVTITARSYIGYFYDYDLGWKLIVYRTTASGTIFYRLNAPIVYNGDNSYREGFIEQEDKADDTTISASELLYTTGGVLENYACPPTNYLTRHQNRIWAISSAAGLIWYSKELIEGEGPAFNPAFTIVNPEEDIAEAIVSLNESALAVFWPNRIGVVYGSGPNDLGQGGSYTTPQMLPGDTGCGDWRSVIKTEVGVFFKSGKGIYLLPLDLSAAQYIGAAVELYRDKTVYSANLIENRHQVRFLVEGQTSDTWDVLIYDYLVQQWHVWPDVLTGCGGLVDSVDFAGSHAILHQNGISVQPSNWEGAADDYYYQDVWIDDAVQIEASYSMVVVTPWIKLAGIQGFERIWRALLLGELSDIACEHLIVVSIYYDYIEAEEYADTVTIPWETIAYQYQPYQYRIGIPKQRCESIKFKITMVPVTSVATKMATLTGLRLEYGIMPRSMRLPRRVLGIEPGN